MRRLTVLLKREPEWARLTFDVESASVSTDEHGNVYLHSAANLLGVVSSQYLVALSVLELPDAN